MEKPTAQKAGNHSESLPRGVFGFPLHWDRSAALGEVHARPAPIVEAPRTLIKLCFITDGSILTDQAVLSDLSQQNGVSPPQSTARHHKIQMGNGSLWWERHTEASTYLWEGPAAKDWSSNAFDHPFGEGFPAPGSLISGVRIDLIKWSEEAQNTALERFERSTLCASLTRNGLAIVATDFRQDKDGLTRFVILDKGMAPQRLGSLSQRLFDIEIYRTLAMLGLPLAQRLAPNMRKAEDRLAELTHKMRELTAGGAESLLDEMTGLAAALEADAASSLYRFGASRAYDNIVQERLEGLESEPIRGYDTLKVFLERRLAPAMRTCRAIEDRQQNLSRKLARAATLLRTRIDVELEKQNRDVLQSMNKRAKLQLRLQQTVEGLSVAAVSYYVVGLFSYLSKGLGLEVPGVSQSAMVALFVPVAIIAIYLLVRRVRLHHSEDDE